jgi:D-beta-D-heptose 7-phosphate kinase/D-beta-D-heptose 1-phosphate adenosyltransferase
MTDLINYTIWINGTFDILHVGHIEMIKYAATLGTELIVGIDSDTRVKELKGKNRPFNNQQDRKIMLESIKGVDEVFIFNSRKEMIDGINKYSPEVMVIGAEYKDQFIVGFDLFKKIVYFDRIKQYSSTNIINYLNNNKLFKQ